MKIGPSCDKRDHLLLGYEPYSVADILLTEWLIDQSRRGNTVTSTSHTFKYKEGDLGKLLSEIVASATGNNDVQLVSCMEHSSGRSGRKPHPAVITSALFCVTRTIEKSVYTVELSGHPEVVDLTKKALRAKFPAYHAANIKWWYFGSHGPESTQIELSKPPRLEPLMYPTHKLGGDPLGYMRRYYDSSASVLFILGPPGTGKTSLIRSFLHENDLSAHVTYDEKMLRTDAMFIEFLSRDKSGLMVLEDVTELLQKREIDKNEMMARFLNVSDGLIQFPNKKIIFTTNLHSLTGIDPALLRSGRCYDVLELGPLSYPETVAACKACGLAVPEKHREYLMSELYNQGPGHEVHRVGFHPKGNGESKSPMLS